MRLLYKALQEYQGVLFYGSGFIKARLQATSTILSIMHAHTHTWLARHYLTKKQYNINLRHIHCIIER